MQLLESSYLGLRSARLTFASAGTDVSVTLFPMVHLGDASFYEAVYKDACAHDIVLVEGVRSPVTIRVTRSYRWISGSKRLGLVVQTKPPPQAESTARIVHADLSGEEFERHWRKVALPTRLLLYAVAPAYALYQRWFGTRESLAKGHSLDDLPSRKETLSWTPEFSAFGDAVLAERDKHLISVLAEHLVSPDGSRRQLAIVYGARHMRAVIRELARRGFHCVVSEWMTVFALEDDPVAVEVAVDG